tara:strand:+ start:356 stop:688 length:333 start_codon:yes stop_codon:yes gene_type:complete
MIDPEHNLPMTRQAKALGLSRSSVYYKPAPLSEGDLVLMQRIDVLHLDYPFAGSRMLKRLLCEEDHQVGRKRIRTLMKRMGIEAVYRPAQNHTSPSRACCASLPAQGVDD